MEVRNLKVSAADGDESQRVREADLARHLTNENGDDEAAEEETDNGGTGPSIADDFQLREALTLLKGVNIVRANDRR